MGGQCVVLCCAVLWRGVLQLRFNKVSELIHSSTNHRNLERATVTVHFQSIVDKVMTTPCTGSNLAQLSEEALCLGGGGVSIAAGLGFRARLQAPAPSTGSRMAAGCQLACSACSACPPGSCGPARAGGRRVRGGARLGLHGGSHRQQVWGASAAGDMRDPAPQLRVSVCPGLTHVTGVHSRDIALAVPAPQEQHQRLLRQRPQGQRQGCRDPAQQQGHRPGQQQVPHPAGGTGGCRGWRVEGWREAEWGWRGWEVEAEPHAARVVRVTQAATG